MNPIGIRGGAQTVLRTGFISTLHPLEGAVKRWLSFQEFAFAGALYSAPAKRSMR